MLQFQGIRRAARTVVRSKVDEGFFATTIHAVLFIIVAVALCTIIVATATKDSSRGFGFLGAADPVSPSWDGRFSSSWEISFGSCNQQKYILYYQVKLAYTSSTSISPSQSVHPEKTPPAETP